MCADDVDRGLERGIGLHVVGHVPVAVGADDLHVAVPLGGQGRVQVFVPALVVALFVPAAEVVDGQAVRLGAVQPADQVVDHVLGPEAAAADPAGRAPGEPVQLDRRIAGFGLFHQPELVARVAVDGAPGVLVAAFGAVGGVGVAADLDLEDVQRGTVSRLEQVVEDLAALRFRIVDE